MTSQSPRHATSAAELDPRLQSGERVVVAMSGGVDSSVAAWFLVQAGLEPVGLFMRNGVDGAASEAAKKSCCSQSDARDARMVAAHLGIPFHAIDLQQEFSKIIEHFIAEYGRGRTPNPCALCNRDLKFGRLLEFAQDLGASHVVSGHYARIEMHEDRVHLLRGVDRNKDQSYVFFCVPEAGLARTILPLGAHPKPHVRSLAKNVGIRTAEKPDSQEICFVPSNDYRDLLSRRGVELHSGQMVDTAGKVLGDHPGTEHFTVGQRRGLGVAAGHPLYVVDLNPEQGRVTLGSFEECHSSSMVVEEANWIGFDPPAETFRAHVQVRYHHEPASARLTRGDGDFLVEFDAPQSAVAPGQGAAVYRGDRMLGGGWIARPAASPADPPA